MKYRKNISYNVNLKGDIIMKKKSVALTIILVLISTLFFGCKGQTIAQKDQTPKAVIPTIVQNTQEQKQPYNGRVFYEIFVRAFNDSNGDGIGDLKGVTQKLDYLSKDLGVTGIWLMPINSSPSYHGYDVSDYYNINKDYGTLDDFKELIKEAHKRNIQVLLDLVINHTSTENAWFKDASSGKDSKYRDYYIWANQNTNLNEGSRISTKPWTALGNDHYYALFWKGMPDLNYDNKSVRDEMKKIAKFYLDMGIDGFRLDAAMHIYNDDTKNVQWWKEFSGYVKSVNKDAVLVGEVWNDTSMITKYTDSLDSAFNFPTADSIIRMVGTGKVGTYDSKILDVYKQYAAKNKNFIDAPFLSNHDQDRVMDVLASDERAKKAAAIYLTLPGAPFIYYGEETGMTGKKPDEAIRQPFIWDNKDKTKNSSWEGSTNDINKIAVNVQLTNKDSLLNFYRQMISIRNSSDALKYGDINLVETDSSKVFAFKRTYNNKSDYIFINLGNEDIKEKATFDNAKVVYSDKGTTNSLSGNVNLKANEVLILEK